MGLLAVNGDRLPRPTGGVVAASAVEQLLPSPVAAATRPDLDLPRASRSRQVNGRPAPAARPVLAGCAERPVDLRRYRNGRLPESVLCALPGAPDESLVADAAVAFARMAAAYRTTFGNDVCVLDGYRPVYEQVALRRMKPRFAARPGSSAHGWGVALDLGCGVQSSYSPQSAWLRANAGTYGWYQPAWARRGGSRPEPWHWVFGSEDPAGDPSGATSSDGKPADVQD